jgi:hypothetical protein
LNGELIQGIKISFSFLNLPNPTGAPNAIRWHTPTDLSPQSISGRSERVTLFLYSSSGPPSFLFTDFLQRMYLDTIPAMPRSARNRSSSSDLVAPTYHLRISSHMETLLVRAYLQDMVVHLVVTVCRVAVVPPATVTTPSFSSSNKGLRPWLFPFFYTVSTC